MTTRTTAAATAAASPVCALRGEVHPVHAKYSTTHRARRCYFHTIERYAAFFASECAVAMAGAVNAQKRFQARLREILEGTMSQARMILYHLQRRGSITPFEALNEMGCFRLAARIDELRRDGHPIRTEMVEGRNGKRWAKYRLEPTQVELF